MPDVSELKKKNHKTSNLKHKSDGGHHIEKKNKQKIIS